MSHAMHGTARHGSTMFSRKTMEKPKELGKIEIFTSDGKFFYSPGEEVSGTVKVTNIKPIQSKAIKVNFQGYCGVSPKLRNTAWVEVDQYVSSTVSMEEKGTNGCTLQKGSHTFPFTFVIPATAPSSYFGDYGRNIFEIQAFVDTPHFSADYKTGRPTYIVILKPLNLNDVPHIQDVSLSAVTKNFTYMLVKNGTIVLKASSDMRGYTPGQVIKLETEIENRSGKTTSTVVASLIKKVTYKTKRPIHGLRTVAQVVGTGVKAKKEVRWREQIVVPPLPHSTLQSSSLITIEYYVQVSLKSPNVSVTLPIYIGNVAVDRTCHNDSPSASLVKWEHNAQDEAKQHAEEILTKSHSQPQPPGSVSPHAFHRIFHNQTFGSTDIFIAPFFGKE